MRNNGKKIIIQESIGFFIILFIASIFDFLQASQHVTEIIIELFVILIIAIFVLFRTYKLIRQIIALEGFIMLCASCKKILLDNHQIPIEKALFKNTELRLSHGMCPECCEKYYGSYLPNN